jgi:hypothetical protein
MIFFGDILPVFLEYNRYRSTELAFGVTLKFFIIGGATWFLSKFLFISQAFLDFTVGISQAQIKPLGSKKCITRPFCSKKSPGTIPTMSTS